MSELPEDMLVIIAKSLTLENILSLARTNSQIYNFFKNPTTNRLLAEHYGFPYGLTYVQLKEYEAKSYNERMLQAAKIGDERIVKKMIEFGANNATKIALSAIAKDDGKMLEIILKNANPDISRSLTYAGYKGEANMIDKILSLRKDEITTDMLNEALDAATTDGKYDAIVTLVEHGADDIAGAIESLEVINSRDNKVLAIADEAIAYLRTKL